jgi:hypothetical protein
VVLTLVWFLSNLSADLSIRVRRVRSRRHGDRGGTNQITNSARKLIVKSEIL